MLPSPFELLGYDNTTKVKARDPFAQVDQGTYTSALTVGIEAHDSLMAKLTPLVMEERYDTWRPWLSGGADPAG